MAAFLRCHCALLLVAALTMALTSGCGKKGPLIAPEALVPAPISNLAVAQKGAHLQASWSAPGKQEGGAVLRDLAGFLLFRRVLLPPAEDCEECPGAYSRLARIDLDYPKGVRQIGNLFVYDDFDLQRGTSYQYKVRSFTTEAAESRDSNKAHHRFSTPPPAPVVEALSSSTGVVLALVAARPEEGTLIGYNIYRSKKGEQMPLAPLNPAPVKGATYEDQLLLVGVPYNYAVTSVSIVNGETVESAPSNVVEGVMSVRD